MSFFRYAFALAFIFLALCEGQLGQGLDAWTKLEQIDKVLSSAHMSGSLVFQGYCGRPLPEAPPVQDLPEYSGQPIEVLQRMFVHVSRMSVSQDGAETVRTVQPNVPTDLLDFKVHDLLFFDATDENLNSHGANIAVVEILINPEVRAFLKAHKIGPSADRFEGPGDAASGKPIVYGRLKEVTVSQALDYILQTFPGFWIYENCANEEGERTVRIWVFERRVAGNERR